MSRLLFKCSAHLNRNEKALLIRSCLFPGHFSELRFSAPFHIVPPYVGTLQGCLRPQIQEGLAYLMEGRTTFVIAHRLSTIHRANQILVIEGSCIVERGTHEELDAAKGRYHDLPSRQQAGGNMFWHRVREWRRLWLGPRWDCRRE